MDWRYERFDEEAASRQEWLERLQLLYHDLLLQAGGDPERALRWLAEIGKRYKLFERGVTLEEFKAWLERIEVVKRTPEGLRMTARGESVIRRESLDQIFGGLARDGAGDHGVPHSGEGLERLPETRPWSYGDPAHLIDPGRSLHNALTRGGPGALEVREEDLEVFETEHLSSCATVLLIDISHSMILYGEDRITPAKRVALALCELIRTRYPKDDLAVVTFGDDAREVPIASVPYIEVGPFHTNTRGALVLARELLRRKAKSNRQIFMVTDGKPSALTERDGSIYKNPFGLDRRIVARTLDEAAACRRYGIPITTFMLTGDPTLVEFVEEFTRVNRGRAYFSGLERLGTHLFVDYMQNRRRAVR